MDYDNNKKKGHFLGCFGWICDFLIFLLGIYIMILNIQQWRHEVSQGYNYYWDIRMVATWVGLLALSVILFIIGYRVSGANEKKEQAEQERIEREKAEQERKEREKAEQERKEKEKAEQERKEKEKAEQERKEKEEQERKAKEEKSQEENIKTRKIFCINCGNPLPENAKFCMICGAKIPVIQENDSAFDEAADNESDNSAPTEDELADRKFVSSEEVVFEEGKCPVCGNVVEKTDSVCKKCGFPVISISADDNGQEMDKIKEAVLEYRRSIS